MQMTSVLIDWVVVSLKEGVFFPVVMYISKGNGFLNKKKNIGLDLILSIRNRLNRCIIVVCNCCDVM